MNREVVCKQCCSSDVLAGVVRDTPPLRRRRRCEDGLCQELLAAICRLVAQSEVGVHTVCAFQSGATGRFWRGWTLKADRGRP